MAEITIRFRHEQKTGRRELIVHLESDEDVLGHEHERDHRRIVEHLIGQKIDDNTDVIVSRGVALPAAAPVASSSPSSSLPSRATLPNKG